MPSDDSSAPDAPDAPAPPAPAAPAATKSSRLLTGSIPLGILGMAVPMIASNIFHSVQSIVDMKFVGSLGAESIAAVGMSGQSIWILITVFIGLSTATGAATPSARRTSRGRRCC